VELRARRTATDATRIQRITLTSTENARCFKASASSVAL